MDNVTFHIYLTHEDKKRPEVIELLLKYSGNTKAEMDKYLKSHDVIEVSNVSMSRAQGIIYEFNKIGVVANVGSTAVGTKGYDQSTSNKFLQGYKLGWNWWAFFFTFLWYAFKGLWVKLSVYIMVQWLINMLPLPLFITMILGLGFWIYLGMYANYDLSLKDERNEKLWLELPFSRWKKWYIIVCIAFLIFAVAFPIVRTVKSGVYTFKTLMEGDQGVNTSLELLPDVSFTYIPKTWWKAVNPPRGMTMSATIERGRREQTLEYKTNKDTKLIAAICTAPPLIGVGHESIGVVAIDVLKPTIFNKYKKIDDAKMVKKIIDRMGLKLPFLFGWLKRFFAITPSEPVYKVLGSNKWGRCTINKEINIFGEKFQSPTDAYWTIVKGSLVLVYTDYFPHYKGKVQSELERVLSSLKGGGMFNEDESHMEEKSIDANTDKTSTADEILAKGDNVSELIQVGTYFLDKGERKKTKIALQKAVNLATNEEDLKSIMELRERLLNE